MHEKDAAVARYVECEDSRRKRDKPGEESNLNVAFDSKWESNNGRAQPAGTGQHLAGNCEIGTGQLFQEKRGEGEQGYGLLLYPLHYYNNSIPIGFIRTVLAQQDANRSSL